MACKNYRGDYLGPSQSKLLSPIDEVNELMKELNMIKTREGNQSEKINFDPEGIEKGMAKLVLTIMELLYQLMERQALRRMEGGSLTEEQVEQLGLAFMKIDARIDEIVDLFGLCRDELNLDLGPLGNLI